MSLNDGLGGPIKRKAHFITLQKTEYDKESSSLGNDH